ncbi:MAG: molybdate ABC transporter substrate-binding protein [Rhizobiaceae bacterium]
MFGQWLRAGALLAGFAAGLFDSSAEAATVKVAVASNFSATAIQLANAFQTATSDELQLAFASTGKIHAQVLQHAPFEVFLSADAERPRQLEELGLAVNGTRFTYAMGRIALYSSDPSFITGPEILKSEKLHKLAIANPKTAPYGVAAQQVIAALELSDDLNARLVLGENIAQAFQFVQSGNAQAGFVALAQIQASAAGSRWLVPAELHEPLRQDAVLLVKGMDNPAARAFLRFLAGETARAIIASAGYALPLVGEGSQ